MRQLWYMLVCLVTGHSFDTSALPADWLVCQRCGALIHIRKETGVRENV